MYMYYFRILACALFVFIVPILLISSSVLLVINAPLIYSYGFERYEIDERTGIEYNELINAAGQIVEYFNNGADNIVVSIVVKGILVKNLYNDREIAHMRDVKQLVKGVYSVQVLSVGYLAIFMTLGFAVYRWQFTTLTTRLAGFGGILTVGMVIVVVLGSVFNFDQLFLTFHMLSFSNDLWQLDPRTDYLIVMFPQEFFFYATFCIIAVTIFLAIFISVLSMVILRGGYRFRHSIRCNSLPKFS